MRSKPYAGRITLFTLMQRDGMSDSLFDPALGYVSPFLGWDSVAALGVERYEFGRRAHHYFAGAVRKTARLNNSGTVWIVNSWACERRPRDAQPIQLSAELALLGRF